MRYRPRQAPDLPVVFRQLDAQTGDFGQGVFDAAFSRRISVSTPHQQSSVSTASAKKAIRLRLVVEEASPLYYRIQSPVTFIEFDHHER